MVVPPADDPIVVGRWICTHVPDQRGADVGNAGDMVRGFGAEVCGREFCGHHAHMAVRVDEPGQQGCSAQVDNLRAGSTERQQIGGLSDVRDAAVPDGNGVNHGCSSIHGEDIAVDEYGVRRVVLGERYSGAAAGEQR